MYTSIFARASLRVRLFFSKIKKTLSLKIFLTVLLNLIKQFDLETYQPDYLPSSSFELHRMKVDLKWTIQFNGSKDNLDN